MTRKTALQLLKKKKLIQLSKRLRVYLLLGLIGLLLIIAGYAYRNYFSNSTSNTVAIVDDGFTKIEVTDVALSPLINGHYQAWLEADDKLVPLDSFNVNPEGTIFSTRGKLLSGFQVAGEYQDIKRIFITVEANGDDDQIPSNSIILESTSVTIGQKVNLEFTVVDFNEMSGQFILSTPSNGEDSGDETSGVWFVDNSFSWLTPSLDLPELAQGWHYRPWVFYEGEYALTTGSFSSTLGVDNENPYSGDIGIYQFPGEDFFKNLPYDLTTPIKLNDGKSYVLISIEPSFSLSGGNSGDNDIVLFPLWALQGS
ncbi:hypothetical protein KC909_06635, partial [Candidatus Dojkabacteria bacterium]|nr:hypothetical protein [Candidatus Dojkabacteria bacterium]